MFTGLIEEIGVIRRILRKHTSSQLIIGAERVLEDLKIGDSVSTNGVCLTVVQFGDQHMMVDVMPETMSRSGLGNLRVGARVNLERAMPVGARLGGHIVTGHIDTVGSIIRQREDVNARWLTIKVDKKWMRYIVEKGSVAVDGVSLTVADLGDDHFSVSLIPLTQADTTLQYRRIGDAVNLEFDILGKYVERMVSRGESQGIDRKFLIENGF